MPRTNPLVAQLKALIDGYVKYQNPSDETQAKSALKALTAYEERTRSLTHRELTPPVVELLNGYKGNSREQRRAVKGNASRVIAEFEGRKRLMQAHQEKIQSKLETQKELLAEFHILAKALQKVTTGSNLLDYDVISRRYKKAQQEVLANARTLKEMLSGEDRATQMGVIGEIQAVSEGVNEHTGEIDAFRVAAKKRIKQATLKAAEQTSQLTVGQFLRQLVEASGLTLTGMQQQAIEGTGLSVLLSSEQREQLEAGDTSQLLTVIDSIAGHATTKSDRALVESLKALVRLKGDAIPDLPIAALPAQAQIVVIASAFDALAEATGSVHERELLGQLASSLSRDIQGLLSGEKTHLTVAGDVDGNTHVVSIPLAALLENPLQQIESLGGALFDRGMMRESLTVMLSNPVQAQALLELQGSVFDQRALMDVSNEAHDQLALSGEAFGQLGRVESKALTELREAGFEPHPLTPEQVMQVASSIVTAIGAINRALDPEANLTLTGGNTAKAVDEALPALRTGLIEGRRQAPHRPTSIHNTDKRQQVIDGVENILATLKEKVANEQYDSFKPTAEMITRILDSKLNAFKSNEDIRPETLHRDMSAIIQDALPKFDMSPSLFAVFKNALIQVANVFRGLVGASKFGLFRPDTHAALKETQHNLDTKLAEIPGIERSRGTENLFAEPEQDAPVFGS